MVVTHQTNPMLKKKILIIGYGRMGKYYEKFLKKKYDLLFYDNKKFGKKFLDKVDKKNIKQFYFIIIATPPSSHFFYCNLCVQNKKNFIIEKPLLNKKDNWIALINKIKKYNLTCSVAYPRRFGNAYQYIKRIINQNKIIGNLKIIKSNYSQNFRKYRKDYKKTYYSSKKDGGGIVFDALTHHINLQCFFAGPIKKLDTIEKRLAFKNIQVSDTALLTIEFKSKIFGIVFGNQFQIPNIDEIEFIGDKNNIIFDRIKNKVFLKRENKKKLLKKFSQSYEIMFKKHLFHYIEILGKNKPLTSIEEDYNNLSHLLK